MRIHRLLLTGLLFVTLLFGGLGSILKPKHKPVIIPDAAMTDSGMLVVAVPVDCEPHTQVFLNGRELRNRVDFRATPGGIYPLPGPYKVEWMAHRARHKVVF